jgi:hypothetical protein
MVIIQVHVGRNLVDDMLLDEGFGANIIIEDLKKQLGLPSPKLAPYMLRMANQNLTKLIKNTYTWNSIHCHIYRFAKQCIGWQLFHAPWLTLA